MSLGLKVLCWRCTTSCLNIWWKLRFDWGSFLFTVTNSGREKPEVNGCKNITNPDSSMPVWGITGENNLQWSYHSPWLQIKCPICENKMTEMISKLLNEMDNWGSGWQSKGKSVTAVPTSLEIPSLHHNIPDQATKHVLRRQTSAGRGEDSVFTSVMLGAYMQSQWITVFIWCRTFNVKMPTILSSVSCCYSLHLLWNE